LSTKNIATFRRSYFSIEKHLINGSNLVGVTVLRVWPNRRIFIDLVGKDASETLEKSFCYNDIIAVRFPLSRNAIHSTAKTPKTFVDPLEDFPKPASIAKGPDKNSAGRLAKGLKKMEFQIPAVEPCDNGFGIRCADDTIDIDVANVLFATAKHDCPSRVLLDF
jgi:hypothetical protein